MQELPILLSPDGRSATWNPGLVRARSLEALVRGADGSVSTRPTANSGRVRVREGERVLLVRVPAER
jgi:hypothetical protein